MTKRGSDGGQGSGRGSPGNRTPQPSSTPGGRITINEGRTVKGGVIPTTGTLPTRPVPPAPSKGSGSGGQGGGSGSGTGGSS